MRDGDFGKGGSRDRGENSQGIRRLDAGTAMQWTSKVPPAWYPTMEKCGYPFRILALGSCHLAQCLRSA